MGIPEAEKRSLKDNMGKVYHQAAVLVKETLGVDGAVVFDISQFDAIESVGPDGKSTLIYHADFYEPQGSAVNSPGVGTVPRASKQEFGSISDLPILGAAEDLVAPNRGRMLSGEDHAKISKFLATCPDGKIYERLPSCFKHLVPPDIQYTMLVPVFNVDRQPFALLCAYTTKGSMHFLEGYELQYLRAIGVIILSAVLKRRMMLADKSKALFISNISHELRTPLHGILASAELLSDTRLTVNQSSYLQTVQACATSLVETVNHVLDFTKLSGSTKPENDAPTIKPQKINLQQLVDETVEGCWLGARARESHTTDDYGSMYSPPKSQDLSPTSEYPSFGQVSNMPNVETVTDIALRHKGWIIKSDRGGIRRILMNLIGNSLKFTHKGFIQVGLKELPPSEAHPNKCMIELSVSDSGKGISKEFLQNRMFQPFSQENPLQSGTGLGLAIVNNIVKSLNGKVDMWSAPEWGTQARITLPVDLVDVGDGVPKLVLPGQSISVSMMGFDQSHPGTSRLYDSIADYLVAWWGFTIVKEEPADILVVNEGIEIIKALTQSREFLRPVVLLSYSRGDPALLSAVNAFERLGGWCRIVFKPTGPTRLQQALSNALAQLGKLRHTPSSPEWTGRSRHNTQESTLGIIDGNDIEFPKSHETNGVFPNILTRRHSDELRDKKPIRPGMGSRSTTYHSTPLREDVIHQLVTYPPDEETPSVPSSPSSTFSVGEGAGVMLKSAAGTIGDDFNGGLNVLLVDDNGVNRNLLAHWLRKKVRSFTTYFLTDANEDNQNYTYREATDGLEAVQAFMDHPPGYFDGE
ncbi:His Kinase A domain containing protein [Tulasnella sp. 418]|nr:His Kinase A domain containing protein [Tulasnella sp. 418]